MKVIVVGAGLGGLGAAMRLQGAGHDVTVLEQMDAPGGRASQIIDGGYTWDTGPSLLTMPWVMEETFAAAGLDFHREVELSALEPYYRIHWSHEERHLDFVTDREAMKEELAKFSSKDALHFDSFLDDALRPIYEEGILGAGRRSFDSPLALASFLPTMIKLGAALPLHTFVSRHFENDRIREAMGFHSLFIGGDPFRVPAIYGALVYLQFLDGVHYAKGGVYAVVEAMARHLDVRCGVRVDRIEHRGGKATGVVTADGEVIDADVVVWNGDATRLDALLGVRGQLRTRRNTMSALLLYLGTDRQFPELLHHTLMVGTGYKRFIKDVTARRRLPENYSTYIHAPSRTEPGMAPDGHDSIAILLPVPNLKSGDTWDAAQTDEISAAVVRDLEESFGVEGLAASTVVEHRMTPADFRDRLGAVDGNAFAIEPTLHQSAAFRVPNRHPKVRGVYAVGGGSHPGAGVPGVLFGAEVTANLVVEDHPRPGGRPNVAVKVKA